MNIPTPHLDAYLSSYGKKIIKESVAILNAQGKNSSGRLSRSLRSEVVSNDTKRAVEFFMEEYGQAVDMGRDGTRSKRRNPKSVFYKGGNVGRFPNITAIKTWTQQKPVTPRNFGNGKVTVDSLVYLIGRKIERDGTAPSMFFSTPILENSEQAAQKVQQELSKDLDIYLELIIK